jgi:hypothetical protein
MSNAKAQIPNEAQMSNDEKQNVLSLVIWH